MNCQRWRLEWQHWVEVVELRPAMMVSFEQIIVCVQFFIYSSICSSPCKEAELKHQLTRELTDEVSAALWSERCDLSYSGVSNGFVAPPPTAWEGGTGAGRIVYDCWEIILDNGAKTRGV